MTRPADRITNALARAAREQRTGLVAFITGGYPDPAAFPAILDAVASEADVVEIGIPFSDPMADGVTIQRSSHAALAAGATVQGILDAVSACPTTTPVVLMSYLNPLLQYGFDRLATNAERAGVAGFIVPDLPLEECDDLRRALEPRGLALIQLVSPATPGARVHALASASQGFLYAVTVNGVTGQQHDLASARPYLAALRATTTLPVCAGFGIRTPADVRALSQSVDGVIIGSALIDAIDRKENPRRLLAALREASRHPEMETQS